MMDQLFHLYFNYPIALRISKMHISMKLRHIKKTSELRETDSPYRYYMQKIVILQLATYLDILTCLTPHQTLSSSEYARIDCTSSFKKGGRKTTNNTYFMLILIYNVNSFVFQHQEKYLVCLPFKTQHINSLN